MVLKKRAPKVLSLLLLQSASVSHTQKHRWTWMGGELANRYYRKIKYKIEPVCHTHTHQLTRRLQYPSHTLCMAEDNYVQAIILSPQLLITYPSSSINAQLFVCLYSIVCLCVCVTYPMNNYYRVHCTTLYYYDITVTPYSATHLSVNH